MNRGHHDDLLVWVQSADGLFPHGQTKSGWRSAPGDASAAVSDPAHPDKGRPRYPHRQATGTSYAPSWPGPGCRQQVWSHRVPDALGRNEAAQAGACHDQSVYARVRGNSGDGARGEWMPTDVTRRRFMFHTLGVIGGTMVAGDLLPLLAEAAKRKLLGLCQCRGPDARQ
jgi:hypothetical protein